MTPSLMRTTTRRSVRRAIACGWGATPWRSERATGLPVRRAVLVHVGTSEPFEEVLEDRDLAEARASAVELVTRALSGS